jgi:hypothetical protein
MALTYITKAAEHASAHNARVAQQIAQITNLTAKKQQEKNKQRSALVKEGQQFANDFFTDYEAQTKSGKAAWNDGASKLVGKLATEQAVFHEKAFGSGGTPELRNEFRLKVARDRRVLQDIGSWAVLSNESGSAIGANQDAVDQDIDLGRVTRGSSNEKYAFSQNIQNDQYSSFEFDTDESGNVILNATNVDKNGIITRNDTENLSADVANNAQGNDWFTSIGEDDLLQKSLGNNWNGAKGMPGLSELFEPTVETNKIWDKGSKKWIETKEKKYDPTQVKNDLLGKYSKRLDVDINSPGFEKKWDQLWRGGFLRDNDGNPIVEGEISWREIKQINSMSNEDFGKKYGDLTKDGVVDEKDKEFLTSKANETARVGLANYYSELLSPQDNELLEKNVVGEKDSTGKVTGQLTEKDKLMMNANKPTFSKLVSRSSDISLMPVNNSAGVYDPALHQSKASAIAKDLNNNKINGLGTNFPANREYMTGKDYIELVKRNYPTTDVPSNIEDQGVYMVTLVPNKKAGSSAQGIQQQAYVPRLGMHITKDQTGSMSNADITTTLATGAGITPPEQSYMLKNIGVGNVKTYDTKEAAANARFKLGSGNVVAGTGKNKGKWIITKI